MLGAAALLHPDFYLHLTSSKLSLENSISSCGGLRCVNYQNDISKSEVADLICVDSHVVKTSNKLINIKKNYRKAMYKMGQGYSWYNAANLKELVEQNLPISLVLILCFILFFAQTKLYLHYAVKYHNTSLVCARAMYTVEISGTHIVILIIRLIYNTFRFIYIITWKKSSHGAVIFVCLRSKNVALRKPKKFKEKIHRTMGDSMEHDGGDMDEIEKSIDNTKYGKGSLTNLWGQQYTEDELLNGSEKLKSSSVSNINQNITIAGAWLNQKNGRYVENLEPYLTLRSLSTGNHAKAPLLGSAAKSIVDTTVIQPIIKPTSVSTAKIDPSEGNSNKSPGACNTVQSANNGIFKKIVVSHAEFPDTQLSEDELIAIVDIIDELMDESIEEGLEIKLTGKAQFMFNVGKVVFNALNEEASNWIEAKLKNVVAKRFSISVNVASVSKRMKVMAFIFKAPANFSLLKAMRRIKLRNKGLIADDWTLITEHNVSKDKTKIVFSIDQESFEVLFSSKFNGYVDFGQVMGKIKFIDLESSAPTLKKPADIMLGRKKSK